MLLIWPMLLKTVCIIYQKNDPEGKGTGISIFVKNGSIGEDYQKAVRVLKAVRQKIV